MRYLLASFNVILIQRVGLRLILELDALSAAPERRFGGRKLRPSSMHPLSNSVNYVASERVCLGRVGSLIVSFERRKTIRPRPGDDRDGEDEECKLLEGIRTRQTWTTKLPS